MGHADKRTNRLLLKSSCATIIMFYLVAPDELEPLDSTEDYESDVSDDIITAVEQSVVK